MMKTRPAVASLAALVPRLPADTDTATRHLLTPRPVVAPERERDDRLPRALQPVEPAAYVIAAAQVTWGPLGLRN